MKSINYVEPDNLYPVDTSRRQLDVITLAGVEMTVKTYQQKYGKPAYRDICACGHTMERHRKVFSAPGVQALDPEFGFPVSECSGGRTGGGDNSHSQEPLACPCAYAKAFLQAKNASRFIGVLQRGPNRLHPFTRGLHASDVRHEPYQWIVDPVCQMVDEDAVDGVCTRSIVGARYYDSEGIVSQLTCLHHYDAPFSFEEYVHPKRSAGSSNYVPQRKRRSKAQIAHDRALETDKKLKRDRYNPVIERDNIPTDISFELMFTIIEEIIEAQKLLKMDVIRVDAPTVRRHFRVNNLKALDTLCRTVSFSFALTYREELEKHIALLRTEEHDNPFIVEDESVWW